MVEYDYDAWGRFSVSGNFNLGYTVNPFKYRGYYYDNETALYYLESRYYDQRLCRFINADNIHYADPTYLNGLNLYAYCNNNPVMNTDPTGHSFIVGLLIAAIVLFTPIGGVAVQTALSTLSYVGMAAASIFSSDIRQDMNNIGWNPFNTDESAVLNSNKVSFYKGVPVFRTNLSRSGTFLGIFLSRKENDIDTVKHEWGHIGQEVLMGPGNYALTVGIQSWKKLGRWSKIGQYYNAPWETMADMFGGVSRTHTAQEKALAVGHLFTAIFFGPFSYLFVLA